MKVSEACATRLCSHTLTFSVGLILEPRKG